MKNLIIIGARGFGREAYNLALACKGYQKEYIIKGYLDDKTDALDGFKGYPPIIDSVEHYAIQKDDVIICALGNPFYKKEYVEMIQEKGGIFYSLIAPNVGVGTNSKIGKGCIIMSNSVFISCDVSIGDYVTIHPNVTFGHDVKIGNWCELENRTFFGGFSEVEDEAIVHTGAIILPRKKIGRGAIVGAGAVVVRDVKPGTTVYGNPAVRLK